MREATRHGKLRREKVAKLLERESPEFMRWAVGDDEELGRMMEAAPVGPESAVGPEPSAAGSTQMQLAGWPQKGD